MSLASLARFSPSSIRHAPASTSAIETPLAPLASTAICFAALAKGTPRARPDKRAVGIERDAILRACRRHRHRALGRGDFCLRQQPSRQHGLGQRHRDGKAAGRAQHAENLRRGWRPSRRNPPAPRPAAGRPRSAPARAALSSALLVAVDGLGIGEIRENLLRGLGDNVLTLGHGVPRFDCAFFPSGCTAGHRKPSFLAPDDGEKPPP